MEGKIWILIHVKNFNIVDYSVLFNPIWLTNLAELNEYRLYVFWTQSDFI